MQNTSFMKVAWSIFRKDLIVEMRSRELLSSMGLFALMSILVFSFTLELTSPILTVNEQLREINTLLEELGSESIDAIDPLNISNIISGVMWATIAFAVILGLNRSLASEREQGNLDAMLIAPVSRSAIFLGKMLANFVFSLIVGLVLLPLVTILFNINLVDIRLVGVMVLGVLGFSSIGTMLATMAVQTRSRETMLPIMMLPAALPILLSVVRTANGIIADAPADFWSGWMTLLLLIDMLYFGISYFGFPFVIEE